MTSDSGPAIQRGLDDSTPVLELPTGLHLVGRTLRIRSGKTLRLAPGAVLRWMDGAGRDPGDYLLTNANPAGGDRDIVVEGGEWDGNNAGNPRPSGSLFAMGYTGAMLHFENVRSLTLRGLHLRDAEAYHARFTRVRDFLIEDICVSATRLRPNNDGIHLGGHCEHGVIRRIRATQSGVTGDDLVALNADDSLERTEVRGMTCGPIRDIRIEDLEAEGCHTFVRMLSVFSPIEDIDIRGVHGGCEVSALNCDAARGCRVPLFDEARPPFSNGVGLLRNIRARDFHVFKFAGHDAPLLRLETRMENFRVENFTRDLACDASPATPTARIRHCAVARLEAPGAPAALRFGEEWETGAEKIATLFCDGSDG